jgi:ribosomal protein S12 methylthiotransferase accessory factor YcaO
MVRLSEAEYTDTATAAREAGLTPSGYAAEAALAAARAEEPPARQPLRVALAELIAARVDLSRLIHGPSPEGVPVVQAGSGDPASPALVLAATAVSDAAAAVARTLR